MRAADMHRFAVLLLLPMAAVSVSPRGDCKYVIQLKGPVYDTNFFENVVDYYLANNEHTCVHHCHDNKQPQVAAHLNELSLRHADRFKYKSIPFDGNAGHGNRNAHKFFVSKGLQSIRLSYPSASWILQIRTDQLIRLPGSAAFLRLLVLSHPVSDVRGRGRQLHRLVTSSRLSFDETYGWCHIDDHFMFGHINDVELYWGLNTLTNLSSSFSKHVQHLEADWNAHIGYLTPEAEFCQIYLQNLGRSHSYDNIRSLVAERWIVVRAHILLFDIWNYHGMMGSEYDLYSVCSDENAGYGRNELKGLCIHWESSGWSKREGGYVADVCQRRVYDYDCRNDTSHGKYSGAYLGDDFYSKL